MFLYSLKHNLDLKSWWKKLGTHSDSLTLNNPKIHLKSLLYLSIGESGAQKTIFACTKMIALKSMKHLVLIKLQCCKF